MTHSERNSRIIELISQGLDYSTIASMEGLTRQRVSQIAIEAGYVKRPNQMSDEHLRQLIEKNAVTQSDSKS